MAVCHLESCFFIFSLNYNENKFFWQSYVNYCTYIIIHHFVGKNVGGFIKKILNLLFWGMSKFYPNPNPYQKDSSACLLLCFAFIFENHIINNHQIQKLMFNEYRWNLSTVWTMNAFQWNATCNYYIWIWWSKH